MGRVKRPPVEPRSWARERRFSDVDGQGAGQAGGASGGDASVADQDVDCGEVGVGGVSRHGAVVG